MNKLNNEELLKKIEELEQEVEKAYADLQECAVYETVKEEADDAAKRLRILVDSLTAQGFTEEQAMQIVLAGMGGKK